MSISKKISKKKLPLKEKKNKTSDENTSDNSSRIKSLMKSIRKTHSLRHIMNFIKIFRATLNEENSEKIVIDEGDVFNDIMQFSMTKLPDILKEILTLVF